MEINPNVKWLRDEANRLRGRLDQVALNLNNPERTDVQKAGDVALMASDLCEVLRGINRRGLFKALAADVEKDQAAGVVSIKGVRDDIRNILDFERGLLKAFRLTEGAVDDLLAAFENSKLLREAPHFAEAIFMKHVNDAIDEVCSVPKSGTVLWTKQTYRKLKKRYGMVGGMAIAAANISAVMAGGAALVSASKLVGALIVLDGTGPPDASG